MKVKIKKNHENAVIPFYSKDGDAAMDLTAVSMEQTKDYIEYDTGISYEIPEGYVGLLFPRSSVSNKDLVLSNGVGVVDETYRGNIKFRYKLTNNIFDHKKYSIGERVGQIIILPYPKIEIEVSESLSETIRGGDGFGSSGK
jgi:dUTP pyrophosphatase